MALVTLAEVQEDLDEYQPEKVPILERLIDEVSGRINTFCGRNFEQQNYSEEIDIEGTTEQSIKLSNLPIISVVALTDNGSLVASDDYHVYRQGRISLEDEYFTEGFKKVSVSYVAGFTPVPYEIKNVARRLVTEEFRTRKRRGFLAEKFGDYSYRIPDYRRAQGFPADVLQVLMSYKIVTGA